MNKVFADDDHEGVSDDEGKVELLEISAKKKKAEAKSLDSDDDLPEVFSMSEGKNLAQQRRNEERASVKRIAAEAKKKKQERAEKMKNEKKSKRSRVASDKKKSEGGVSNIQKEQLAANDMLDESVVKILSEHERMEVDEKGIKPLPVEDKPKKSSKRKRERTSESRIQIMVLDHEPLKIQQHTGLHFKHQHFYGDRIRRDSSMLRKMTTTVV